jgi:hypothetical protein
MAATINKTASGGVIKITGTPTATGDFITADANGPMAIVGYNWTGSAIASGDSCVLIDGRGNTVLEIGYADARQQFMHGECILRPKGLAIKTMTSGHGTLYLYT